MHCAHGNEKHILLIDNGKAKRQPIVEYDINQAVVNILQTQESIGQTYELGGSQVYTLKELFEFMANNMFWRVTYSNFKYDDFMRMYLSPNNNWEKAANWMIARPDYLTMQRIDNVITKKDGIKTMDDLHIIPLATHHYISDIANFMAEKSAPENPQRLSIEEQDADDEGH
jgi:hypothetical protein